MPALYATKGLRYLRIADKTAYDRCILAFADAIKIAWQKHQYVDEPMDFGTFHDIPNRFAGGRGRWNN